MRYMRLFYSGYLFVAAMAAPLIAAVSVAFSMSWLDARASIDLDALRAQVPDNPAPLARFRAFVARALKHDCFTAGYFDPGRMPA